MTSFRFSLALTLLFIAALAALPGQAAAPHGDISFAADHSSFLIGVHTWGSQVGQAPTITQTVPLSETVVISFAPQVPEGAPQEGSCWTNSLAVPREDAWRCMVGNSIYDPCFATSDGKNIVCGASPVTDEPGFALKLTEPLPTPDVSPAAQSAMENNGWLIELADQTDCGFLTGATAGIEGERINYGCSDGTDILGDLEPGIIWQANKVQIAPAGDAGFTATMSETVPVVTVWQ